MHRIVTARTEEGNAFSEYRPPRSGNTAEFYYLCGAGPLCRCRPWPGEESPGNAERRAS